MPLVRGFAPKTPVAPEAEEVKGKMNGLRPPLTFSASGAFLSPRGAQAAKRFALPSMILGPPPKGGGPSQKCVSNRDGLSTAFDTHQSFEKWPLFAAEKRDFPLITLHFAARALSRPASPQTGGEV